MCRWKSEKDLVARKSGPFCPEHWTVHSPRQPSKLREETLESLPYRVRRGSVKRRQFFARVPVQLEFDQEFQLRIREQAFRQAPVQEVPQQRVSLERIFEFNENGCLVVGLVEQRHVPAFSLRPF